MEQLPGQPRAPPVAGDRRAAANLVGSSPTPATAERPVHDATSEQLIVASCAVSVETAGSAEMSTILPAQVSLGCGSRSFQHGAAPPFDPQ